MPPKKKIRRGTSRLYAQHAIYASRNGACSDAARLFERALDVRRGGLTANARMTTATIIAGNCKRRAPKVAKKISLYAKGFNGAGRRR